MKVFISQPMNGKTDEQIREERRIVEIRLHRKLNEKFEILDTVFDLDEGTHPLVYLGKSIEKMAEADIVCFMEGWDKSRGCLVEYATAVNYGLKRYYLHI